MGLFKPKCKLCGIKLLSEEYPEQVIFLNKKKLKSFKVCDICMTRLVPSTHNAQSSEPAQEGWSTLRCDRCKTGLPSEDYPKLVIYVRHAKVSSFRVCDTHFKSIYEKAKTRLPFQKEQRYDHGGY